jgi:hypothetical protein
MNVSNEVLAVLGEMEFEGTLARFPAALGQLDRKLYQATDKVLQACGGKWNRARKGHIFTNGSDARALVELVLTTGTVQTNADLGFFPTPPLLARDLVELADVKPGMRCLEPSAGEGAIVLALQEAGGIVTAIERDQKRRLYLLEHVLKSRDTLVDYCDDFMKFATLGNPSTEKPFDRAVMNPAFLKCGLGDHINHVKHAYSLLADDGILVSVMPASIRFRDDKRHREFRSWFSSRGDIEDLPDDSFRESGTRVRTCTLRLVK